ncbi:MAG: PAS domain-containing protein [Candidatus Hodarchaeales archaeon]
MGNLMIDRLLTHLPVEISFIDEMDNVAYYSGTKERIFPRSPGVIGRNVQKCHPPKSLDKVNQIISAFKSGQKNHADFWIEMSGKFLYIRYFAGQR